VGAEPRIAQELVSGLDDKQVIDAINKTVQYYKENAKKGERLGKMIERVGLTPFQEALA
jgi:NAD(P)H-nitrite reductase large subunit